MIDYLEIAGVIVGLVYLWLEYKASVWLWLTGIIMPAIYIFVYYYSGFYADMGINIYYLLAGIYGWALWLGKFGKKGSGEQPYLPITHTPARYWKHLFLVSGISFVVICFILIKFTDSTVPYGDSFTTALSIVGLWMLARKYVEQWLVWIVVDVVCAGLYFYKDLYPTALLYSLYTVIAVLGYFRWKKLAANELSG